MTTPIWIAVIAVAAILAIVIMVVVAFALDQAKWQRDYEAKQRESHPWAEWGNRLSKLEED